MMLGVIATGIGLGLKHNGNLKGTIFLSDYNQKLEECLDSLTKALNLREEDEEDEDD
jgi:hypothetical protein